MNFKHFINSLFTTLVLRNLFFIFFLLVLSTKGLPQQLKYSTVRIDLLEHTLNEIAQLGVVTDHAIINEKYIETIVSDYELQLLNNLDFSYQVIHPDLTQFYKNRNLSKMSNNNFLYCNTTFTDTISTPQKFKFGTMGGFLTYTEMLAELDSMAANYPNLITIKQPIDTFLTFENRPIYMIKISDNPNTNESANESAVLYTALHHAREPVSMMQLIFYMYYLLENYESNAKVKYLVDNLEMYFIPCVNPDGYIFNENQEPSGGGLWRKNRRDNGDGSFGVDLNRNYGYQWGIDDLGSSPNSFSSTYRGTAAFSEPETRAVKYLCKQNNFKIALNYHSFSNVLLYPEGYQNDSTRYDEIAELLTLHNHYSYGTPLANIGYTSNGDSDAWMYHDQNNKSKQISFTPEVGSIDDGFWPPQNRIEQLCKENLQTNLNAAWAALNYMALKMTSDYDTEKNGSLDLSILKVGIKDVNNVNILLQSNQYIDVEMQSVNLGAFSDLEKKEINFNYTVRNNVNEGFRIPFNIILDVEGVQTSHTLYRVYSNQQPLYSEKFDLNLVGWNTDLWGISNQEFVSPPNSITDSPLGNYKPNIENTLVLNKVLNLTNPDIKHAYLRFNAKWEIEDGFDYVQILVYDGNTEKAICGNYTNAGSPSSIQPYGEPLYDGIQKEWIEEHISLDEFIGKSITIKFQFKSDGAIEKDGFYIDNVRLFGVYDKPSSLQKNQLINDIEVFPNPTNNTISIYNFNQVHSEFYLTNILGEQLKINHTTHNNKIEIDLSELPKGMYWLYFNDNESVIYTKKIIKN